MSTMENMLDSQIVQDMVDDLKDWPNSSSGDDDQELAVGPFVTFYFLFDTKKTNETVLKLIDIHEAFETIAGSPYTILTDPTTERPLPANSDELPNLRHYANGLTPDEYFIMKGTSNDKLQSSSTFGLHIHKARAHMNDAADFVDKRFSFIKFHYRWKWWLENKEAWRRFVLETNATLNPYVVYSGFAVINPLEMGTRADAAVWERALTPYFYGLDIDFPIAMNQLGFGIRPPTWGFFLSDALRSKLDYTREEIQKLLTHPGIRVDEQSCGQWIELGEEPSLFSVEDGFPLLPAVLNSLLKSVRDDEMSLLGFAELDDDPNERFTPVDSTRWLKRFDNNSDWPSYEVRSASLRDASTAEGDSTSAIDSRSGHVCSRTGE